MYENATRQGFLGAAAAAAAATPRGQVSAREQAEKQLAAAMHEKSQLIGGTLSRDRGMLEVAIDSAFGGLDEAHAALQRLADRMDPVLQPELPTPSTAAGGAVGHQQPTSVAVARLQGLRAQLELLTCRINSLSARLDT